MKWTALVPLKGGETRKSRLAGQMNPEERFALSDAMARHVLDCLSDVEEIGRLEILSPEPVAGALWHRDEGRGLNAELDAWRVAHPDLPLLVIHGDLPLLKPLDIVAMLAAAERAGSAIAPDRHGTGTNALALFRTGPPAFAFGTGSCAAHAHGLSGAAIVIRLGLQLDVDSFEDLVAASDAGFARNW